MCDLENVAENYYPYRTPNYAAWDHALLACTMGLAYLQFVRRSSSPYRLRDEVGRA